MIPVQLCVIGLFMTGCAFQQALDGERLLGFVPPVIAAVLAVVGAVGFALTILEKIAPPS